MGRVFAFKVYLHSRAVVSVSEYRPTLYRAKAALEGDLLDLDFWLLHVLRTYEHYIVHHYWEMIVQCISEGILSFWYVVDAEGAVLVSLCYI